MTSIGRLLLCLLLCCWYVDDTRATNPGLSKRDLNQVAKVAAQKMSAKIRGASLQDQSGQSDAPVVGKVHYEVKNTRVGGTF